MRTVCCGNRTGVLRLVTLKETRDKLEENQKQLDEIEECLQNPEPRLNLFGFFETLVEIAKKNPEIIKMTPHLQSLESEDKK